ncbi:MAG: HAMP domain-containing sensor histidine kinase [Elusimicrobiota bacterium]|nr:HAMP domain-containing sensor histidine kinase [Elusimicrobiota bacterium]
MPEEKLPTKFLPAEKAGPAEIERHRRIFAGAHGVTAALDGMLNFSAILNLQRQAVFLNKAFADFLSSHGITDPIGQRPGDLFSCKHSTETEGGCGTTESCIRCGAGQALEQALNGNEAVRECRIMSRTLGEDQDLRVSVKPFNYNGEGFLLMSLLDISSEKRRQVLERIFFHDILNTAGGVQGLIGLMAESEPAEIKGYVPAAAKASDRMIDQIFSQRDLAAAERGDLQLKLSEVGAAEFFEEIAGLFKAHEVGKNKEIVVAAGCQDAHINTDRTLLSRVIGNLLKNALEAESPGARITLSCEKTPAGAAFTVHNPGRMPEDSRLQVFQRSFSTKGAGRGLGTYSIRLLTEKYLKGKVSFTTGPEGTTFRAEYPASLS